MRIIVDTNLWISILIGRSLAGLLDAFDDPRIDIISTSLLKAEIKEVMKRKKFAKYFTAEQTEELMAWFNENTVEIPIPSNYPQRCRDPKDDYLLELAIQSDADILLTGDEDLLVIRSIGHCQIITVHQFLSLLATNRKESN